jgi:2-amino-4-hydroxy-6-hydroxymethyldihydropteridine diphosphokinase
MTPDVVTAYISVGSNIEPLRHIPAALARLLDIDALAVTATSTFWQTPAIDRPQQEDYRNGVWQIRTAIGPRKLHEDILRPVEAAIGRVRTRDKYAPRSIDLDLVLYGRTICDEAGLTLPHPDLTRPWVAAGVVELDPKLIVPGETMRLASRAQSGPPGQADAALTTRLREAIEQV